MNTKHLKIFLKLCVINFYLFNAPIFCKKQNISQEKMYFCAAADSNFMDWLLNLIGSIHKVNFNETAEIAIFDLGLTQKDKFLLNNIKKVKIYNIEMTHPDLLKHFIIRKSGKNARGWYAWKPVIIKQALEKFPYVLYLDAGTSLLKPINGIFSHIINTGYFIPVRMHDKKNDTLQSEQDYNLKKRCTNFIYEKFLKNNPEKDRILNSPIIISSVMGFSRAAIEELVLPMYEFTKDLRYFSDDGTCVGGFGNSLHDLTLYSILIHSKHIPVVPTNQNFDLNVRCTKKINFLVSKFMNNIPNIMWHCKGKISHKKFIKYKN